MSHPLSDVESKLLFDKLNRRAKLLKSLNRNPLRSPWYLIPCNALFFGLIMVMTVLWVQSNGSRLVFLAGLLGMGTIAMIDLHIAVTNSRIDTLIGLLQQEGVLGNPPAASHENQDGLKPILRGQGTLCDPDS
jgi:hypothetical protein